MKRKAFTLTELLIILAIIAILIGISVPGLAAVTRRFQIQSSLEATAINITKRLTEARSWSSNQPDSSGNLYPVKVSIESDANGSYSFTIDSLQPGKEDITIELLPGVEAEFVGDDAKDYYYVFGLWTSQESPSVPYSIEASTEIRLYYGGESKTIEIQNSMPKVLE